MNNEKEEELFSEPSPEVANESEDPFIGFLHKAIRLEVKVLEVLMVTVIVWGIGDVVYVLYQRLIVPPFLLLSISDILATFGAFLAVLIAIKIFINITLYIKKDVIPVRIVVATALMAISRKVKIFDFGKITPPFVVGIAAVVLALGITYWPISRKP